MASFSIRLLPPASGPPWLPAYTQSIERGFARLLGRTTTGRAVTAGATLTTDDGTVLANATSGAIVLALPPAASVEGRIYTAKKVDASGNAVTLDPNGAETIDGAATKSITTQWASLTIQAIGGAWFII